MVSKTLKAIRRKWRFANVYEDGSAYEDDVTVDADTREYHYGHMLASGLGGSGNLNNVFEQDGGQNTQGDWPSFERQAQSARDSADDDSDMRYKVTLTGNGLNLQLLISNE